MSAPIHQVVELAEDGSTIRNVGKPHAYWTDAMKHAGKLNARTRLPKGVGGYEVVTEGKTK